MKSTTTLFTLFLLCAFFTSYLPSATADFVLDTDGNPLENGGIYYVLQTIILNGGGIEHAAFGNETCPFTVVQSREQFCKGFPITISSPARILNIYEGLSLNIGFTFAAPCSPTSEWTIVKDQPEGLAVKLSGFKIKNTVPGVFKIERVPVEIGGYNILFCPLDDSPCGYVGVHFDQFRNKRLVVTQSEDNRMWVRFQKLSYASRSTHSTA